MCFACCRDFCYLKFLTFSLHSTFFLFFFFFLFNSRLSPSCLDTADADLIRGLGFRSPRRHNILDRSDQLAAIGLFTVNRTDAMIQLLELGPTRTNSTSDQDTPGPQYSYTRDIFRTLKEKQPTIHIQRTMVDIFPRWRTNSSRYWAVQEWVVNSLDFCPASLMSLGCF